MEDIKLASVTVEVVLCLLSADKKIKAVKIVRDLYVCGLKEAKDFVELLEV